MPRRVHSFDPPDRFVVGTVGEPGQRTFYLQASGEGRLISLALEKAQVAVLADRLGELLDEVRRRDREVPAVAPPELLDVAPLETPIEEEFRVGTMALAWDDETERVVVAAQGVTEAESTVEPFEDDVEGPDVVRVRITAAQARAFIARAERVVAAGRPPCPLCGLPLDPAGHICPRQNGHRAG